ncbi:MAG: hypothetical protein Q8W44_12265 [Candidatus Palauibacterales bacterium]|nr:hypothetical protein [Candidatus Palauibacterales bacterium]
MLRRIFIPAVLVSLLAAHPSPAQEGSASGPPVIDITAVDYAFQAPDSIPSGWVTLRMANQGEEQHHFHVYRLPDGRTHAEFLGAFMSPADSMRDLFAAGQGERARKLAMTSVPDWAHPANMTVRGGVGAVAPGATGRVSVRLAPGRYVLACVIRSPSGVPHYVNGMIRGLTVSEASNSGEPPVADLTMRASGWELTVEGDFTSGTNTVRFVVDSIPDVPDSTRTAWLARLDSTTSAEDLADWIQKGTTLPAPAPFVGGFEYYPASDPIYFTVDLEPGRHGLIWGYRGENIETMEFVVK